MKAYLVLDVDYRRFRVRLSTEGLSSVFHGVLSGFLSQIIIQYYE